MYGTHIAKSEFTLSGKECAMITLLSYEKQSRSDLLAMVCSAALSLPSDRHCVSYKETKQTNAIQTYEE